MVCICISSFLFFEEGRVRPRNSIWRGKVGVNTTYTLSRRYLHIHGCTPAQ